MPSIHRHLFNFVLLFISNVENLLAFMLRDAINETVIEYTEYLLAVAYLYFVVRNFLWFIKPLKNREEWEEVLMWFEDKVDDYKDIWKSLVKKALFWRKKKKPEPTKAENKNGGEMDDFSGTLLGKKGGTQAVRAAVKFSAGLKERKRSNGSSAEKDK